jgi:hypothetical protein
MADYGRVVKIDAHLHLHNPDPAFMAAARRQNFKALTINVDYPDFPPLDDQQRSPSGCRSSSQGRGLGRQLLGRRLRPARLAARHAPAHRRGAEGRRRRREGLKNIGMSLRGTDDQLVMIEPRPLRAAVRRLRPARHPAAGPPGRAAQLLAAAG